MTAPRDGWGGEREGAGRKPGWKTGPCKAVKLPVALVDQVLAYAQQLDEGVPIAPATNRAEEIHQLQALVSLYQDEARVAREEVRRARQEQQHVEHRLAAAAAGLSEAMGRTGAGPARAALEEVLDALSPEWRRRSDEGMANRPSAAAAPDEERDLPPPPWLTPVIKQIQGLPQATRLLVLRLLVNHQDYVAEGLAAQSRRPPDPAASERQLAAHAETLARMRQRLHGLELLLATFAAEVAAARRLTVNWGSRRAAAAKKSCDSIQAKMGGPPRVG